MNTYAIAVMADLPNGETHIRVVIWQGTNKEKSARSCALRTFPVSAGYTNHTTSAVKLTAKMIAEQGVPTIRKGA